MSKSMSFGKFDRDLLEGVCNNKILNLNLDAKKDIEKHIEYEKEQESKRSRLSVFLFGKADIPASYNDLIANHKKYSYEDDGFPTYYGSRLLDLYQAVERVESIRLLGEKTQELWLSKADVEFLYK